MKRAFCHGGDIYSSSVRLDFSVNTNPFGMPEGVRRHLERNLALGGVYPDGECRRLRQAIGNRYGQKEEHIICGNGATELLFAFVGAVRPAAALLPAPSFAEYERALLAFAGDFGTRIQYALLPEASGFAISHELLGLLTKEVELLVLCNPGNPVGNVISREILREILQKTKKNGTFVLVDESFLEFLPDFADDSVLPMLAEYTNVFLLNGFTKLYGLAGLRLGYGISHNKVLISRMKDRLPCWNVSSLAQEAGVWALAETDYLERSRRLVQKERERMAASLRAMGLRVLPSLANFLCFQKPGEDGKTTLAKNLLKQGILIRDCSDYRGMEGRGYYRVAVKMPEENEALLKAIASELE